MNFDKCHTNDNNYLLPGSRVTIFDPLLFKDDISTPPFITIKPATVVRRYGFKNKHGVYPDCIDVVFDHRPGKVSHGHFTKAARRLIEKI